MIFVVSQLAQYNLKFVNIVLFRDMLNFLQPMITNGSTGNLCAIDVSKAFDHHMNHDGLFIKLMQRSLPSYLLPVFVFEKWFNKCFTCVILSRLSELWNKGGVLTPHFFTYTLMILWQKLNH
jgi:hypothetical protein